MLTKSATTQVAEINPGAARTSHAADGNPPPVPAGLSPERALVERAQQGDEQAFATLYDTYRRRVYSLCLRMTGDPSEAEDLAQEAFLRLFRKISSFRGESAFSTWLYRLVANVVLMHLRKKRLPQVSLDETDSNAEEPTPKREFGENDRRLAATTDRLNLQRAIGRLPRGYRAVFVLHDVEGYEHAEIARLLHCTSGNCKSQLHKARLRLREWLTAGGGGKRRTRAALQRRLPLHHPRLVSQGP